MNPPKPKEPETLWTLWSEAEHLANLAEELRRQADSLAYDTGTLQRKAQKFQDRLEAYAREHDPEPATTIDPRD